VVEKRAYGATGVTPDAKAIANYGAVFQPELYSDISTYVGSASSAQRGRAIGRVGAHEVGHFLLNEIGHDAFSGHLMNEGYPVTMLVDRNAAPFFTFDKPQSEAIQARCNKLREAEKKGGGGGGGGGGPAGGGGGITIVITSYYSTGVEPPLPSWGSIVTTIYVRVRRK